MKHPALLRRLFLLPLLFFALACTTLSALSQPVAVFFFAPDDSASATPDSLEEARRVLQKRFDYMFPGGAIISVSDDTLNVTLMRDEDPDIVVQLATRIGEFVIGSGSGTPVGRGDVMPPDVEVVLSNSDIAKVKTELSDFGGRMLFITFTEEGARTFADFTASHTGEYTIIGHDGIVLASPRIAEPITGGEAIIQVDIDEQEAELLVAQLKSGRLPFPLRLIEVQ